VARSPLATVRNQVSDEMKKVICRPKSVSTETKLASCQYLYATCKGRSASKAIWTEKFTSALCDDKGSPVSASAEAHVVFRCETTLTLHRNQTRFSRGAKGKALKSVINKAVVTSLLLLKFLAAKLNLKHHIA